jgi:hypothetical protein
MPKPAQHLETLSTKWQVPTQNKTRRARPPGLLRVDEADANGALLPDAVVGEQLLQLIQA